MRVIPTTRKGYHTYDLRGETYCSNCCSEDVTPGGTCRDCGTRRYWVEDDQDEGAEPEPGKEQA